MSYVRQAYARASLCDQLQFLFRKGQLGRLLLVVGPRTVDRKFKLGDVVRLKSGGPNMTISGIGKFGYSDVEKHLCRWLTRIRLTDPELTWTHAHARDDFIRTNSHTFDL